MALEPHVLPAADLASAWLAATEWTAGPHGDEQGLVVTVRANTDGTVPRNAAFEAALSGLISRINEASPGDKPPMVAFSDNAYTIFPENLWRARKGEGRDAFYERYKAQLPRIKKLSHKNVHGIYFERMVAFASLREGRPDPINQLEYVIGLLNRDSSPRQSALQITIFHPAFDHTGAALRGFPCLQQVSFAYSESGVLHLNAYYPTQYLFERGYGNYLGLCHLGRFVAEETGFGFSGMTCFIGAPRNALGKRVVRDHLAGLRAALAPAEPAERAGGNGA